MVFNIVFKFVVNFSNRLKVPMRLIWSPDFNHFELTIPPDVSNPEATREIIEP
jgi:hypothetical protein